MKFDELYESFKELKIKTNPVPWSMVTLTISELDDPKKVGFIERSIKSRKSIKVDKKGKDFIVLRGLNPELQELSYSLGTLPQDYGVITHS